MTDEQIESIYTQCLVGVMKPTERAIAFARAIERAIIAELSARQEPVAWRNLYDAANAIHGAIDQQTYDEKRHADFDLPGDYEYSVTITADQERALSKAICAVENASPLPAAPDTVQVPREITEQEHDVLMRALRKTGKIIPPKSTP